MCASAVWRQDQHLRRLVSGANRDRDRSDEFDLQGVHPDMQEVRGVVLAVPRHAGRQRGRRRQRAQAPDHPQADRARLPVRLAHRQGRLQDQGDQRGDRRLDSGCLGDAAQLDRAGRHHIRHQRGHHPVYLSHMLRHARGMFFCWRGTCRIHAHSVDWNDTLKCRRLVSKNKGRTSLSLS